MLLALVFQSTPPARGATEITDAGFLTDDISIHAPREGGDSIFVEGGKASRLFQSTPPARGATVLGKDI